MLTPDEIIASFAAASAFNPMIGTPTDNDVDKIRRNIVNFLQSFRYHRIQDSLSGLIDMEARYFAPFSHAFDCLDTAYVEK